MNKKQLKRKVMDHQKALYWKRYAERLEALIKMDCEIIVFRCKRCRQLDRLDEDSRVNEQGYCLECWDEMHPEPSQDAQSN